MTTSYGLMQMPASNVDFAAEYALSTIFRVSPQCGSIMATALTVWHAIIIVPSMQYTGAR